MKSNRRQRAENDLAKQLKAIGETLAPLKNHIYWAIIGILAVICIGLILSRITKSSREKAWGEYFAVFNMPSHDMQGLQDRLETLSKDYQSGEVSVRIRLSAAELLLMEACDLFPNNRAEAIPKLEKACDYFKEAREKSKSDNLLREQSMFGLAQTYESLAVFRVPPENQSDLESAIKTYEQLIASYPDGIYEKKARASLHSLQSPALQRMISYYEHTPQKSSDDPTTEPKFEFDPTIPQPSDSFRVLDELGLTNDIKPEEPDTTNSSNEKEETEDDPGKENVAPEKEE